MGKKLIPAIRFKGYTDTWEQCEFKEIVDVNSGRDYKHLKEGDISVYGTGGYMLSVNEALSYKQNAIGIGRKGTIDNPYILKAPFWTVDTLFYAIPKVGNDLNFVNSIFQNINWKKYDESTGVPSLSKTTINSVSTKKPKLAEQIQIGSFLEKLDILVTLHQHKYEKLIKIKKALLDKMFPKNGELVPKLRFKGFNDAWEQCELDSIANKFDNLRVPVSEVDRVPGTTPYYGANGIQGYVEGYTHKGEYILVAEDGANDLKNYPVQYVNGKAWVNNHAHVLQGKLDISNTRYLKYAISQTNIEPFLVGGGRAKLNASTMMRIVISAPQSTQEQQKIGLLFDHIDSLITLHQCKYEKLINIKKALLQKMFV